MKAMLSGRLSAKLAALVASLALLAPLAAHAETASNLPKGYTSDEAAPAAQAAPPAQPAVDQQPAADAAQAAPAAQAPAAGAQADEYADTDPSALNDFREPLSPYGTWVEDPTYGTVWVPNSSVVGADFAPYQTAGHWTMDDDGEWLWVSDYDWGYIPFHYGRWMWIGARGWSWIPGRMYSPAWVTWRTGDYGYIGWAPYPPAYYWSGGYAVAFWAVPPAPFFFVPTGRVFDHRVGGYVIHDRGTVQAAAAHTQPYKPAQPKVGSSAGGAKSPAGAHASASYRPPSPSLKDAHVPSSAAPKSRTGADSRSLAYSKRSTTPRRSAAAAGNSMASRAPGGGSVSSGGASWAARHGISRPESQAMLHETRHAAPMYRSSDGRSLGSSAYPSRGASSGYRGGSASSYRGSPAYRGSPSYGASPSYRGSPSYNPGASRGYRGGGSVSGWSGPSSRSAPPAYHPSAAPSHFGGGSSFGGGGGFRGGGSTPSYSPPTRSAPTFHGGGGGFGGSRGGGGRHR